MISKLPASTACLRNPLIKIKKGKKNYIPPGIGVGANSIVFGLHWVRITFLMALRTQHEFNVTKSAFIDTNMLVYV